MDEREAVETELSHYLRGEFRRDAAQLRDVDVKAKAALATLEAFRSKGRWPYEISNNKITPKPVNSTSTSAMILFAIGAATNTVRSSVLTSTLVDQASLVSNKDRTDRTESQIDWARTLPAALTDAYDRRLDAMNPQQTNRDLVACYSGTYGVNDPFTLLWLIELLEPYKKDTANPKLVHWHELVCRAAKAVTEAKFQRLDEPALDKQGALNHMFPLLRLIQIRKALYHSTGQPAFLHDERKRLIKDVRDRLNAHLAYFAIRNSSYDAAELAFTMEALLILDPDVVETAMIERWTEVLGESQKRTPYWRPLRPFIAFEQGMVLLPLSVEIANSLAHSAVMLDERDQSTSHVRSTIELLRTYTEWLFSRIVRGNAGDKQFTGWYSEHADDPDTIHTWETSQVLLYLLHYRALIAKNRASRSLELMNLSVERFPVPADRANYLQSKTTVLGLDERSSPYAVRHRIYQYFAEPLLAGDPNRAECSMLLYGPQGTGKTTLATDLAAVLGFPFISISPSDFIVGGGAMVEAKAKALFEVLSAQGRAVILLDEIDRLILDRDSDPYTEQEDLFQFMTPSMLTKLQQLHDRKGPIFIIATNYAERIDRAIKRAGRIDRQFLVLPPDLAGRKNALEKALEQRLPQSPVAENAIIDASKNLVLANLSEIKQVAKDVADTLKSTVGQDIGQCLVEQSKRPKAVTIKSYVKRCKDNGFEPPQVEVLMLLYLLAESDSRDPDQEPLWGQAQRWMKGQHITDIAGLTNVVEDAQAAKVLAARLFTES